MKAAIAFLVALCCLATTSTAWNCVEGPRLSGAVQIDAGSGQVVASTTSKYAYFLMGHRWYRMSNYRMGHVTTGLAGMFGCGYRNRRVYKYVCGSFKVARGRYMKQVDAGGDDIVVGVTRTNWAFCVTDTNTLAYRGVGSLAWVNLRKALKYYSCSEKLGCWGVDGRNRIFHARNVNAGTCTTGGWRRVGGSLAMIEASHDGQVFGVNRNGFVYQRVGITSSVTHGTGWRRIPMCTRVRHVTFDNGKLWVVTRSHLVLKCMP